uniref:Uncharacterized protein n=1 Tax=candidate division CPR3 bacterium TaxID=2268181 RepID=A0A7C4M0D9_UNCC3
MLDQSTRIEKSDFMLKNVEKGLRQNIFEIIDNVHFELRSKELDSTLYVSFLEHFIALKNYTPSLIRKSVLTIEEVEKIIKLENFILLSIEIGKINADEFLSSLRVFLTEIKKIVL